MLLRPPPAAVLATVPDGTGSATSCSIRLLSESAGEGGSEAKPISVIDSAGDVVDAVCTNPEALRLFLLSFAPACRGPLAGAAVERRGMSTGGAAVVLRPTGGARCTSAADRELRSRPAAPAARDVKADCSRTVGGHGTIAADMIAIAPSIMSTFADEDEDIRPRSGCTPAPRSLVTNTSATSTTRPPSHVQEDRSSDQDHRSGETPWSTTSIMPPRPTSPPAVASDAVNAPNTVDPRQVRELALVFPQEADAELKRVLLASGGDFEAAARALLDKPIQVRTGRFRQSGWGAGLADAVRGP
eukprot:COSAG03_NODE_3453_length_2001_cov_1.335436_2_plen_300_part_01